MKNTIIFDLDGTLAIIDKRREVSRKPNGKIDFEVFHDASNISLDEPNTPVIKMAQLFAEDGFTIIIFSGRSDRTEHTTRSWLSRNRVPFNKLVMRPHKTMNFLILKQKYTPIAVETQSAIFCTNLLISSYRTFKLYVIFPTLNRFPP